MSRPKPASPDCIQDIKNRIELLLKVGPITRDLLINTAEAAMITGLSKETYAVMGRWGSCQRPGIRTGTYTLPWNYAAGLKAIITGSQCLKQRC
jgi:hypothetical protein